MPNDNAREIDGREDSDDSDETESFDVTHVLQRIGEGPTRLIRTIETHSDGSTIETEYEEDLPADDPFVLTRQRAVGDGPPNEVFTEYIASAVRPKTYPTDFPFLVNRPSSITESPAHTTSPSAVWRCDDPEVVLAALVNVCVASGWTETAPSSVAPFVGDDVAGSFRRGNDVRILYRMDHEQGSAIRMMDLPGDWLKQE